MRTHSSSTRFIRRSSSLVRTLIVGASTLAILLVVFSMYQFSQMSPEESKRPPRLPPTPTEPSVPSSATTNGAQPGVPIEQGMIGPGQKATITIYPKQGTHAQMELSVREWIPRAGSDHEFLLTDPEIRLRTKDGNNVRVTAREGVLDAQRKSGGGLDPRRGELSGEVVIEFDRRSDKDKALLPPGRRDEIDPAELVRVEADRIEFDLEYAKLVVPGRIHVTARDVELHADDLELRFNESQGRVESLRVARGGRLELADLGGQLAVKVPATEGGAAKKTTLVDWIRASIESQVAASAVSTKPAPPSRPTIQNDENLPVFRSTEKVKEPTAEVRYFAKFDGDVDAKHVVNGATQSRLLADSLEVLREFSDLDKQKAKTDPESSKGGVAPPADAPVPTDRITLEWSGRLQINALGDDDPRSADPTRSRLSAIGTPARLAHPEGEVGCRRLDYEPDNNLIRLEGVVDEPVSVRSANQGSMTGQAASLRRDGDALRIEVTGPGTLGEAAATAGATARVIEFAERLDASGRFVTRTTIDFMGTISSRQVRLLDRAAFSGRVRVREGDTSLEADSLNTTFAEASGRSDRPALSRVEGHGNVVMTEGDDHIRCDAIEVEFAVGPEGASRPKSAVAKGSVLTTQGERTLRATDSLSVEFEATPSTDVTAREKVALRRFTALGDVTVQDPVQGLDVTARQLDCTITDGREIEKAVLLGDTDRPASAKMDALTVTGARINLDVANQWAEVPGAGRISFLSKKDLDGEKLTQPLPIVIDWTEQMKFHGRENRAVFMGRVHATGESTTTFDCDHLLIEFVDLTPTDTGPRSDPWNLLEPLVDQLKPKRDDAKSPLARTRFSKEPVYLLAEGNAVAESSDLEPDSGAILSRSRISGPRLSVNLRPESSRMLIEGAGNLQLEDFRPTVAKTQAAPKPSDLFQVGDNSGASKTLIEWRDRMWYDFSIAQTRFEGKVRLKHLSGAELERLFEMTSTSPLPAGRATFLNCDVLTVDFVSREGRVADTRGRRTARLSGDGLRQFAASGNVSLQDQVEGITIAADNIVYERPRQLLAISGSKQRKAQITVRKPGKMPNQVATERLFYNLATGQLELIETTIKGQ